MKRGLAWGWLLVAAALALPAVALMAWVGSDASPGAARGWSAWVWTPQSWLEPWRLFSSAWVHWDLPHLTQNIAGCLALALLGMAADLPRRAAWAWFLAWPATQAVAALLALAWPALPGFAQEGGLSGALHAGLAVLSLQLILGQRDQRRWVGVLLMVVLLVKLGDECRQALMLANAQPAGEVVHARVEHGPQTAWQPNLRAHLAGWLVGCLAGFLAVFPAGGFSGFGRGRARHNPASSRPA